MESVGEKLSQSSKLQKYQAKFSTYNVIHFNDGDKYIIITTNQLAHVTVSTLNFIVVAEIKEHFFENEIEKSLNGLGWSSYCHGLLTGLSPHPSKALSSTSSSMPTS